MKKLIIICLLIISSVSLLTGQVTGDGQTPATAYYGNLTSGTMTWDISTFTSGFVYVGRSTRPLYNDLTISGTGRLTINGGITVVFCATASDLRVNNGGVLQASGTYVDKVTFTNLSTITNWGHLVFNNSPGASLLNNCIIRNGKNPSSGESYSGGGIYANCNNLTVSNCIIANNYAPGSGGGIYANGTVKIENCLIYSNEAGGYYGGGGVCLGANVTVNNCTIIDNFSDYGYGDDILFESNSAVVRNTIIWRSSLYGYSIFFELAQTSSNLINCAFVEAWSSLETQIDPTFFTASFRLNLTNNAIDGPNFTDPATNNFLITLVSPCRDKGTTQGTPAPPATDFRGISRVGPYDIGAYEVQYCGWRLDAPTNVWSSSQNWTGGVPTSSVDVIIPAGAVNYPTATPASNFTLGTGKQMIIEAGACVTLGTLTNYGTLRIYYTNNASSSLILTTYSRMGSGTEAIQIDLAGGGTEEEDNFRWHFISTPVATLPVSVFDPAVPVDIVQYLESRCTFSLLQGWVGYDGYVYSTGLYNGPTFSSLVPGKGYDYWDDTDNTFTFSGLFNTGDVPVSLSFTTVGDPNLHGFNLLGNPYPSGLDWNYIINSPSYPLNTSKALYFTRNNQQMTYAGGVGVPSDVNGIIPPMQGFFNKTYGAGNSITLPLAARTHNNIHVRYKGDEIIPLVRLGIAENSNSDETVVRFDNSAKPDLDLDFDAVKMTVSNSRPYIYSVTSGIKYTINAQPFPEEIVNIPIVVNVTTSGNHFITANQIQGLDNYYVTLLDSATGYKVDLKSLSRLIFNSPAGTYTDRFVLKISTFPTGIENPSATGKDFNIYQGFGMINIQPMADKWNGKISSITLLDLTGKTISRMDKTELYTNSIMQIESPAVSGIYLVEIRSGALRYTGKVMIK